MKNSPSSSAPSLLCIGLRNQSRFQRCEIHFWIEIFDFNLSTVYHKNNIINCDAEMLDKKYKTVYTLIKCDVYTALSLYKSLLSKRTICHERFSQQQKDVSHRAMPHHVKECEPQSDSH